jgi:hypothetical protein
MKIEIDVSEKNEGTASPWWMIIDPKQMMKPDVYDVAVGMITGPFFSREEGQRHLDNHRNKFSKRALVYCHSGYNSGQYDTAYRKAEKLKEVDNG